MAQQTGSVSKDAVPAGAVARDGLSGLDPESVAFHNGFGAMNAGVRAERLVAARHSNLERARALRRRAGFELAVDPVRSLRTLTEARGIEGSLVEADDRREQIVRETLARCYALHAIDVDDVEAILTSDPVREAPDREGVGRLLLIPWLIAIGETTRARRWLDAASLSAPGERAEWQQCRFDLLEQTWSVADGRSPSVSTSLFDHQTSATPSIWLQLHVNAYWQVLGGNLADARLTWQRVDEYTPLTPPAFRASAELCGAVLQALEDSGEIAVSPPAYPLTLFNIGQVLAAGEAIAIAGTTECAGQWSEWFASAWPATVLRAPAWPVLAHRVRALLACRAGDTGVGLRLMDEAIVLADGIGSHVEAALSRVQYAELLALDPQREARDRWSELSRSGRARCRALGIPSEHHAHRARTAATLGRFYAAGPAVIPSDAPAATRLTGRELEVLRLFSAGHSYREAAVALNVGWRTVQSHAYNAYQKLGVSSKIAAVGAANRLGLL